MLQVLSGSPTEARSLKGIVTNEEWQTRVELAACYRACHDHGWTDLVYTHISSTVPNRPDEFIINPFGLRFDEVTASNLVKVDLKGNVLDGSSYPINEAGFLIHGAIHEARPDAACVLHLHTEAGMAVSMLEGGLDTRLSQHAARFHGRLAYHDFEGIALDADEKQRLVRDIGGMFSMILRNHGFLTAGRSIGEAFTLMFYLEKAARSQLLAASAGTPSRMSEAVAAHTCSQFGDAGRPAGQSEWPAVFREMLGLHADLSH